MCTYVAVEVADIIRGSQFTLGHSVAVGGGSSRSGPAGRVFLASVAERFGVEVVGGAPAALLHTSVLHVNSRPCELDFRFGECWCLLSLGTVVCERPALRTPEPVATVAGC